MPNPHTANQKGLETPNDSRVHEVSRNLLPIHCPMPGSSLWDSHPRVYIPVEENGWGKCPYCGTEYILKEQVKGQTR